MLEQDRPRNAATGFLDFEKNYNDGRMFNISKRRTLSVCTYEGRYWRERAPGSERAMVEGTRGRGERMSELWKAPHFMPFGKPHIILEQRPQLSLLTHLTITSVHVLTSTTPCVRSQKKDLNVA